MVSLCLSICPHLGNTTGEGAVRKVGSRCCREGVRMQWSLLHGALWHRLVLQRGPGGEARGGLRPSCAPMAHAFGGTPRTLLTRLFQNRKLDEAARWGFIGHSRGKRAGGGGGGLCLVDNPLLGEEAERHGRGRQTGE